MYKSIIALAALFAVVSFTKSELVNPNEKPEPTGSVSFEFPDYSEETFPNGLRVFYAEDDEQPTFAISLEIFSGYVDEGEKNAVAEFCADMLTKGTSGRNAEQIASEIDGVGAYLSVSSGAERTTINAGGLVKHFDKVMDVLIDVLTAPTFPEDELKKLKERKLAALQHEKTNPSAQLGKLSRKALYGENHPYGKIVTESDIEALTVEDLREYYEKYYLPNNACLAGAADIPSAKIMRTFKEYFSNWEKEPLPSALPPAPERMPQGVYFVERPGSAQSSIMTAFPTVEYGSRDYEAVDLAADVMGASFAGRLFKTLREEHNWTYRAFGRQTQNEFENRFFAGADVNISATDSAVDVIYEQLRLLGNEGPDEDELAIVKKYVAGNYLMNFENSLYAPLLLQDSYFYGKTSGWAKSRVDRLDRVSAYAVREAASSYLRPGRAYVLASGNPESAEKLERFGPVYRYDLDLKPLSGAGAAIEKSKMTAEQLLGKYLDAIGGKNSIDKIETLIDSAVATRISQGKSAAGSVVQYTRKGGTKYIRYEIGPEKQEIWIKDERVWVGTGSVPHELIQAEQKEPMLFDAVMFRFAKILDLGYEAEVLGKQSGQYVMRTTSPTGTNSVYRFDADTFLLEKIEQTQKTQQGTFTVIQTFKDYETFDGVKMPTVRETKSKFFTIKFESNYKINPEIDDEIFVVPE